MIHPLLEGRAKKCTKFCCFFGGWENLVFSFRYLLTFSLKPKLRAIFFPGPPAKNYCPSRLNTGTCMRACAYHFDFVAYTHVRKPVFVRYHSELEWFYFLTETVLWFQNLDWIGTKGQLNSKCPFDATKSTKKPTKFL